MLTTGKDHTNALFNIYVKTLLNFNSLRAVNVIVLQNISNNTFTLFPCHIVFLSVHMVIHKSVDSFHLYATKII
jgi:hypothetical protein